MRSPRTVTPLNMVQSGLCIGCGSCVAQGMARRIGFDRYGRLEPKDATRQGDLQDTCPFSPQAANEDELSAELFPETPRHERVGRFLRAYVGAVSEGAFRTNGSSGGMVSWVITELLRSGIIDGVAHVAPSDPREDGRFFKYRISRTFEEVSGGAKSRYYPVELSQVLHEMRERPGRYAVVGVPCFIKALQLLRRKDPVLQERIAFTLGLFCGHMKSAQFVESFAMQLGVPMSELEAVEFRVKDASRPASTYTTQLTLKDGSELKRDWWDLVGGDWGSGFFQYSACNFCDDVIAETADISFGDAWVEPYSSDGRGTNVVVVRSAPVQQLIDRGIEEGRLELAPVDEAFIVETQSAGFRQRREGLAYRLTWPKSGIRARKRVYPGREEDRRRRLIYRMRAHISKWSHPMFWLAKTTGLQGIFTHWGATMVGIYHGLAYRRGRWGAFFDRLRLR